MIVHKRRLKKWLTAVVAAAAVLTAAADTGLLGAAAQDAAGQVLDAQAASQ